MHHFVDACGAELRSCCVFRIFASFFYLLLCDVGCFFVIQSHSIKVSRWSSLVIFSFFSSPVVLPRSLCRLLRVEPNLRGLGYADPCFVGLIAAFDWVFSIFKFLFEEFVDVIFQFFFLVSRVRESSCTQKGTVTHTGTEEKLVTNNT